MKPIARNLLAVITGIVVGSVVNMLLVNLGPMVVPLPEGADVSNMEALRETMHLFTPINFLFPFLAHALGTLVGAFTAARLALSQSMRWALVIGVFFLVGGMAAALMIGGPLWFNIADLLFAYLPMAFLGGALAVRTKSSTDRLSEPIAAE